MMAVVVDSSGFDNYATILDQFLNVCARVCVSNFSLFSGVQPDFTLTNACDTCSEAFLWPEVHYGYIICIILSDLIASKTHPFCVEDLQDEYSINRDKSSFIQQCGGWRCSRFVRLMCWNRRGEHEWEMRMSNGSDDGSGSESEASYNSVEDEDACDLRD